MAKPTGSKSNDNSNTKELQRRLNEARKHRSLLIEAVHGMAMAKGIAALDVTPDTDDHARYERILNALIQALVAAGYRQPITPDTKVSDLNPDPLPIVVLINERFFPDRRFTTGMIDGSNTLRTVALRILRLNPPNI